MSKMAMWVQANQELEKEVKELRVQLEAERRLKDWLLEEISAVANLTNGSCAEETGDWILGKVRHRLLKTRQQLKVLTSTAEAAPNE